MGLDQRRPGELWGWRGVIGELVDRVEGGEGEVAAATRAAFVGSLERARDTAAKEDEILVTLIRPGFRGTGGAVCCYVIQVPGDGVVSSLVGELACKGTESFPD